MKVSENQLLILLSLTKEVANKQIKTDLEPSVLVGLQRTFDEIMVQQNEIVDTTQYQDPSRDELLRLALGMFESLEVDSLNHEREPEEFYASPMGQTALKVLYPDSDHLNQEDPDE